MPYADMFLYDVKCFDEQKHKEYTGVSNKLILENLKKISDTTNKDIIIRIPVIHGVNDDEKEMGMIAEFLKGIRYTSVDLLPYHKMGEHKYDALDMAYTEFEVPDKAVIEQYKKLFVR
jgi:pyruvate formate lyase activating enzyme